MTTRQTEFRNACLAILFASSVFLACQTDDPSTTSDDTAGVTELDDSELQPLLSDDGLTIEQAAREFYDGLSAENMAAACWNLDSVDTAGFVAQSWEGQDSITFGPGASFPNDEEHRAMLAEFLKVVQADCAE